METLESAFDRPRRPISILRWVACIAAAVALVLLGLVLAPRGASSSRSASQITKAPHDNVFRQAPPAPPGEPTPLDGPGFLDQQEPPAALDAAKWCATSSDDHPTPPESSWPTAVLATGNATYTLRHPTDWQVSDAGGAYLIASPGSTVAVAFGFGPARGLTPSEVVANGQVAFAESFPDVDIQRSERAMVAGTPGCRVLGTQVVDGFEMEAEFVWTVVGDEVVGASLYVDSAVTSSEKEIGRRVLNSLAVEASNASTA